MKTLYKSDAGKWFCFTHAVQRAMKGELLHAEVDEDDFCSEYDFRNTSCVDCCEGDDEDA